MPLPFPFRRARTFVALAAALSLTAGLAISQSVVFASSTRILHPVADGYVTASSPNANFGGSDQLRIDGSPRVRTYLRFDLRGLSGSVSSARLRLFAESPSGLGYRASRTDGANWSESSLTWNSKPGLGSAIGVSRTFRADTWTEVNVTAAVKTGLFVDFALDGRNGTAIRFASAEEGGSGSHSPQRVETVGGVASGSGATPTARPTTGTPRPTAGATPTAQPTATPKPTTTVGPPAPTPTATPAPSATSVPPTTGGFQIIAGGDTRTNVSGIQATAKLILAHPGDPVLDVGDDTANGSAALYQSFFNPAWGQFKSRIWPVPGNHEYMTAGASGYFGYYGSRAGTPGQGWYSFNLPNNWHVIALNSNVNHAAGSPQELFLKSDLAANAGKHIIAFWHVPRFTSSSAHSPDTSMTPFWNDLYAAHADLIFNGDSHQYERFGLQNPSGKADPNGIRQFTTGLGGAPIYGFGTPLPNSQVRYNGSWGVLLLTLNAHSYSWQFLPVAGHTFSDSGTQATHS